MATQASRVGAQSTTTQVQGTREEVPWIIPLVVLVASCIADALASNYFTRTLRTQGSVSFFKRSLLWVPTGDLFVWSLVLGMPVGIGYILFSVGTVVTNGLVGAIFQNQLPKIPELVFLGAILAGVAFWMSRASATTNEPNDLVSNGKEWIVYLLSAIFILLGIVVHKAFFIAAFPFTDASGTPISQWAAAWISRLLRVLLGERWGDFLGKVLGWGFAFTFTSYVFSEVLGYVGVLLIASLIVGVLTSLFAPVFEALVYKKRVDWKIVRYSCALGALSVVAVQFGFNGF